jgi:hypothetical protein
MLSETRNAMSETLPLKTGGVRRDLDGIELVRLSLSGQDCSHG